MPPKGWKAGRKPARARKKKVVVNERVEEMKTMARAKVPTINADKGDLDLRREALHFAINNPIIHPMDDLLIHAGKILSFLKGDPMAVSGMAEHRPKPLRSETAMHISGGTIPAAPVGSSHAIFTPAPNEPPTIQDTLPGEEPPRRSPFSETHAL